MRIFGFIIMLVGLAVAFGYPSFHAGFTNFEIGKYTVYDQANGYQNQTIWLTPEDMPIEITFSATAQSAELDGDEKATMLIEIKNGESIIRSQTLEFSPSVNDQSNSLAANELSAELAGFELSEGALFEFTFNALNQQEVTLSAVTMTAIGIVTPPSNTIPTIGYAMIGFGALLYLVGGRRRSKKVGNAPSGTKSKTSQIGRRAEPVRSKEPEKSKQQWGRGSDK